MRPLYFDYNATTPVLPQVFEAMRPYLEEHFGNPSSGHAWGLKALRAVDLAREQLAALLGCAPAQAVFTSCATESNSLVLWGLLGRARPAHLVTTAVEHPAVLQNAQALAALGVEVTLVGVDARGVVDPAQVAAALRPHTRLVSVMLANNETGVLQPVAEVARLCRAAGVPVHADAAQAVGKIPVDVAELGVDYLTVAGHKMYAPKGVGALYVRDAAGLAPLWQGGGQEGGLRAGTENVPHLAALGAAAALAQTDLAAEEARLRALGQDLHNGIDKLGVPYVVHGQGAPRLPQTLSVGFPGLEAGDLLSALVLEEVGLSAGAACHGDEVSVSHVLAAMGANESAARGTLRISWGRPTTAADVAELVQRLGRAIASLS